MEVCEFVGKNALVLTIVECKGLEFHDVLLYNFFGTSPLKDQWRVIYGYMKKYGWLEEKLPQSFPAFNEARHSVLCSELKQLYVAITRTRQRLWICENKEKLSKPMFDYWKKRGLVQVKKLDDSVALAMRVASSPQEWRERGKKFFYGNNFVMATMCFERARDTMWEKLAKASGLRASAYQMRGTNHEAFEGYLREAALMFESIGKLELSATCYCDLGEYERAGKIYMHKCGKFDAAAECFTVAGCYSEAAEAYAKGDQFSNCLSACKRGELFDKGLQYINYWKEHVIFESKELEEVEQEFLESCARDFHENKDSGSMMKFVGAFRSMESRRMFLRSLGFLDELLFLEEESGHFLEAAELASSWGDSLKEADLLEKAGHFKEASLLLLWYVFYSSLWGNGNRGWPPREFAQKEELCNKVKLLAKMESDVMYDFVCSELNTPFDQHNSLPELKEDLYVSQKNSSLRGEILLIRKILDTHLQMNSSSYDWEDNLPVDMFKHCQEKMFQNQVSVRTLIFYWNLWKKHILNIFRSIESPENEELLKPTAHADFCLYYFGVRKQSLNGTTVYLSLNKDADWIRNTDNKGLHRDEKCRHLDGRELVFAIQSYWQSELLSVGIKVLQTLEALHKSKSNGSAFHQSTSLLHIFEVSKFLLDFQCHNLTNPYKKRLQYFLGISLSYLDIVFPLDWRKSVGEDLVSLRETDLSVKLLEEIILQTVDIKALERVIIICLCSSLSVTVYENLINKLKSKPQWKSFVLKFRDGGLKDVLVAPILQRALEDNFRVPYSFLSPHSFGYLLDRLLLMQTFTSENSYTTRSSFVGSLTHIHTASTLSIGQSSLNLSFFVDRIDDINWKSELSLAWIHKSKIDISYFPLFVLKMVMIMSLICLKAPSYSPRLLEYLSGYDSIAYFLPKKFVSGLLRKRKNQKLNLDPEVVAEAFSSIDDPLLIVRSENASPKINAPCAIFVDLKKSKEEIMSILFPRKNTHKVHMSLNNVNTGTILDVSSSETLPDTNIMNHVDLQMNWNVVEEISKAIKKKGVALNKLSAATMIKNEVDINKGKLLIAVAAQISCSCEDASLLTYAIEQLKLLAFAFNTSRIELEHSGVWKSVSLAVKGLQRERQKIDNFLKRSVMIQASKVEQTGDDDLVLLENQSDCGNTEDGIKKGKDNSKGKKSKKSKGKKK